jgi:hypothetical protein
MNNKITNNQNWWILEKSYICPTLVKYLISPESKCRKSKPKGTQRYHEGGMMGWMMSEQETLSHGIGMDEKHFPLGSISLGNYDA